MLGKLLQLIKSKPMDKPPRFDPYAFVETFFKQQGYEAKFVSELYHDVRMARILHKGRPIGCVEIPREADAEVMKAHCVDALRAAMQDPALKRL